MPDIPLEKFLRGVFLPGNTETEVNKDRISEERPEQHPETITAVAEVTDQPASDQKSLKKADQHHQIIRGGVFCDGYLHGRKMRFELEKEF